MITRTKVEAQSKQMSLGEDQVEESPMGRLSMSAGSVGMTFDHVRHPRTRARLWPENSIKRRIDHTINFAHPNIDKTITITESKRNGQKHSTHLKCIFFMNQR